MRNSASRTEVVLRGCRSSTGTPGFLFNRPAFDQVVANMVTESWRGGDLNRAARRDLDGRIDNVLFPIALAGGNIARQGIAGQGRDGDVVDAPNAAFQHTAAPDRNVARQAESLDFPGAGVAADAAQLDINDASGVELESGLSVSGVADGFVETNRGLQLPLELRVIGDVIPPEGLFHHQQPKFIEALEMLQIGQRVSGICVDGEEGIGMRLADGAHEFEVLTGFDLQFDPLVAGVKLDGDLFQQGFRRGLQSQGDTALDF